MYYPVNGISNIFKGFPPLFDLSLSNNDTSVNAVNVTVHQGTWVFYGFHALVYVLICLTLLIRCERDLHSTFIAAWLS